VFGVDGGNTGGTHDKVAFGEDIVCPGDGEWGHDFADERVERRMKAEDFADDIVEEHEVFEVVILQWSVPDDAFLLFIQDLTEIRCGFQLTYMYSGFAPRWSIVHAEVAMEVCCPAIKRAIIICATSVSVVGRPSLYC
jgi:hypothetical protein